MLFQEPTSWNKADDLIAIEISELLGHEKTGRNEACILVTLSSGSTAVMGLLPNETRCEASHQHPVLFFMDGLHGTVK